MLLSPIDPEINVLQTMATKLNELETRLEQLEALPIQRAYVQLADINLSAPQATIDFQDLSQDFRHLKIVGLIRTDRAAAIDGLALRFNNDSGNNYDWLWIKGRNETGTSIPTETSDDAVADSQIEQGDFPAATAPANVFGPIEISIPHYTTTDVFKATVLLGGHLSAQAREAIFSNRAHGVWRDTSAISRVTLLPIVGPNFIAGTRVTIYGLG